MEVTGRVEEFAGDLRAGRVSERSLRVPDHRKNDPDQIVPNRLNRPTKGLTYIKACMRWRT
jgi:hypothetical protein